MLDMTLVVRVVPLEELGVTLVADGEAEAILEFEDVWDGARN